MSQGKRWWKSEGEELGKLLWDTACSLEDDQEWRRNHAFRLMQVYEGRTSGFYFDAKTSGELDPTDSGELNYNLCRAACDTVHAEISGRQKPVPKFQTSNADWKTKRKAKRLERHVLDIYSQPQGSYLHTWELAQDAFLDAANQGTGVVKALGVDGKVRYERHHFHELYVDPADAKYGEPQNLFHIYLMDRDAALTLFAEDESLSSDERAKIRYAIESAATERDKTSNWFGEDAKHEFIGDQIKVVEGWKLKCGDVDGKHALVINGCVMFDEVWDWDRFPFAFMRWSRPRIGWDGTGLTEQGLSIHNEVNFNATKLQERFKLCGAKRTYYVEGSIDLKDLQANEAETLIPVRPDMQFPQETAPKPIADAEMMWLNDTFQKFWEITGVSQMRASARKEPGVTAGVAIRTLNDMQTARFALKAKVYENFFIDLTYLTLMVCRDMAADGIKVKTKRGEEINWSEVDIPENPFEISVAPTSSLPNDPAGRMQMSQELYSSGIISQETFKQLLGWPDLEKEMNLATSQTRWLEKVIDSMLDGEVPVPPDGFLIDKNMALIQVSQAYFDAQYDEAPEEVLIEMGNYLQAISRLIEEEARAQQELMAQQQAMMNPQAQGGGPDPAMAAE